MFVIRRRHNWVIALWRRPPGNGAGLVVPQVFTNTDENAFRPFGVHYFSLLHSMRFTIRVRPSKSYARYFALRAGSKGTGMVLRGSRRTVLKRPHMNSGWSVRLDTKTITSFRIPSCSRYCVVSSRFE